MSFAIDLNDEQMPLIVWQAHEGNLSGANIAMLEYIDALKTTYRSHVILPHGGDIYKVLVKRAIPVTVIYQYGWAKTSGSESIIKQIKRFVRTRIALITVRQLLLKTKAAIVCTNTLIPFVAAKAAFTLGLPHVWWIHEFGVEDFGFYIGHGAPIKAYRKIQLWSNLVVCNSKAVVAKFKPLLPAVDVQCVYQPVSWYKKDESVNNTRVAVYLMFGQIAPSKGQLEVLRAVAQVKCMGINVLLHIKGPCEQTEYLTTLRTFITENNLQEQVEVEIGFFVKEEVMPGYRALILASRCEAFGRVIVEAIKAGLYVIVKNSGGAPELVNRNNGVLYNTTDELCDIFSGKVQLPLTTPLLSYEVESEINYLKHLLSKIDE